MVRVSHVEVVCAPQHVSDLSRRTCALCKKATISSSSRGLLSRTTRSRTRCRPGRARSRRRLRARNQWRRVRPVIVRGGRWLGAGEDDCIRENAGARERRCARDGSPGATVAGQSGWVRCHGARIRPATAVAWARWHSPDCAIEEHRRYRPEQHLGHPGRRLRGRARRRRMLRGLPGAAGPRRTAR